MSGLASSAFAAMQQAAANDRTAENRAITRYRMMTAPDGMQVVPRLETTPPRQHRNGWGCYRMAVYFFRPRAGINTLPRDFLDRCTPLQKRAGHSRRTVGQSTSSSRAVP